MLSRRSDISCVADAMSRGTVRQRIDFLTQTFNTALTDMVDFGRLFDSLPSLLGRIFSPLQVTSARNVSWFDELLSEAEGAALVKFLGPAGALSRLLLAVRHDSRWRTSFPLDALAPESRSLLDEAARARGDKSALLPMSLRPFLDATRGALDIDPYRLFLVHMLALPSVPARVVQDAGQQRTRLRRNPVYVKLLNEWLPQLLSERVGGDTERQFALATFAELALQRSVGSTAAPAQSVLSLTADALVAFSSHLFTTRRFRDTLSAAAATLVEDSSLVAPHILMDPGDEQERTLRLQTSAIAQESLYDVVDHLVVLLPAATKFFMIGLTASRGAISVVPAWFAWAMPWANHPELGNWLLADPQPWKPWAAANVLCYTRVVRLLMQGCGVSTSDTTLTVMSKILGKLVKDDNLRELVKDLDGGAHGALSDLSRAQRIVMLPQDGDVMQPQITSLEAVCLAENVVNGLGRAFVAAESMSGVGPITKRASVQRMLRKTSADISVLFQVKSPLATRASIRELEEGLEQDPFLATLRVDELNESVRRRVLHGEVVAEPSDYPINTEAYLRPICTYEVGWVVRLNAWFAQFTNEKLGRACSFRLFANRKLFYLLVLTFAFFLIKFMFR